MLACVCACASVHSTYEFHRPDHIFSVVTVVKVVMRKFAGMLRC